LIGEDMDILGFFDGLFGAFSAIRSGKNIDENDKSTLKECASKNKQSSENKIHGNEVASRQEKINTAREGAKTKKDKSHQLDQDGI